MTRMRIANDILHDAGTWFVIDGESNWQSKAVLPLWICYDLEDRLTAARIDARIVIDTDDDCSGRIHVAKGELG